MTEDIMYKGLDNLYTINEYKEEKENYFEQTLYLYGGEPFLCPEMIHKCIDYILKKDIYITGFWVITNGSILDENIAKDFQRISPQVKKGIEVLSESGGIKEGIDIEELLNRTGSGINISYQYHNPEQSKKALDFYSNFKNIKVKYFDEKLDDDTTPLSLSYSGRAKNLIDNKDIFFVVKDNHCMATTRDCTYVPKTITVSANGNVFLGLDYEYSNVDNDNLGNVLEESIYDMAMKWNYKHPITYKEMKTVLREKVGFLIDS